MAIVIILISINHSHAHNVNNYKHLQDHCSFFSRWCIMQKNMLMKICKVQMRSNVVLVYKDASKKCKSKWLPFTSNQSVICNKWSCKNKSQQNFNKPLFTQNSKPKQNIQTYTYKLQKNHTRKTKTKPNKTKPKWNKNSCF